MKAKELRKSLQEFTRFLNALDKTHISSLQIMAANAKIPFLVTTTKEELQIALIKIKAYELFDEDTRKINAYKEIQKEEPTKGLRGHAFGTFEEKSDMRGLSGDSQSQTSGDESASSKGTSIPPV